jgi:hypothetical protein
MGRFAAGPYGGGLAQTGKGSSNDNHLSSSRDAIGDRILSYIKRNLTPAQNLEVAKMISAGMRQIDPAAWSAANASVSRNMKSLFERVAIGKVKGE